MEVCYLSADLGSCGQLTCVNNSNPAYEKCSEDELEDGHLSGR